MTINSEYSEVPDKEFPVKTKITYKNLDITIYCSDEEDKGILEEIKPILELRLLNIIQPFESMALDLIKTHENSAYLVIGQSLKILKWALKNHMTDAYVAALTVSGVEEKHSPNAEFLDYLKGKLDKLGQAKPSQIIILDYANKGETLRAIKRDIRGIYPDLKILSIAYTSGGSVLGKVQEKGENQIDIPIQLPSSVSALIDNQDVKELLGRGKPKLKYNDWKRNTHNEESQHIGQRYQAIKQSYRTILPQKEILGYVDEFVKSFKNVEIYARDQELYCPEYDA
ncbi:hypothetical protein [Pseudomonas gingeri]|uniref:hypothetical protein n=1 Tax=Pseudomonas gingeri TaxID=117681 RepID=UPI0015B8E48A|nr:hypothetical protein [Pseudomonas gingeri]NWD48353.1 hypothetical protein [Pseudomonas gingeri]